MDDDKGFTVRDKRRVTLDDQAPGEGSGEEQKSGAEERPAGDRGADFPIEPSFATFVLSLSTSALVHLGELPDPITQEKKVELIFARQTIGIIEMLRDKTRGNLAPEEEQLIDDILYDLRLKYIKAS